MRLPTAEPGWRCAALIAHTALSTLLAAPAHAQEITFDEAIALAPSVPRVRGRQRALEARRRGDADIGGTGQGLVIQATPGARVYSEEDRGFEGTLSIVHSWNLGDLTGARRRAARAERTMLAAETRAAALEARLDAAGRWIDLWRLSQLEALMVEEQALAAALVEHTDRALAAGVGTSMDQAEAYAYRAEVLQRRVSAEGRRFEATLALSSAMGQAPSPRLVASGPLPSPAVPDDPTPYMLHIERMPSVAIERFAAAAERAHEVEAVASHAGALGLGAQLQRESPDGFIVNGVLTFSLPLTDHGERQRSVARGEAERREGEHDQARLAAARELALAIHDVDHMRHEESVVVEHLVPALTALAERREAGLRAGESTIFQLIDARRRLLGARATTVMAATARAWAEVRLWVLLAEIERSRDGEDAP